MKTTITVDDGLSNLLRPHVVDMDLDAAYEQMASDETSEAEAMDWAEATVGDAADES